MRTVPNDELQNSISECLKPNFCNEINEYAKKDEISGFKYFNQRISEIQKANTYDLLAP